MQIETERLLLRAFCPTDLDAVHAYVSDEETMLHMGGARSREWAAKFIDWQRRDHIHNGYGLYAMVERASGTVVGDAGLQTLGGPDAIAGHRLRYVIDRRHWGQGYATEAACAVLRFAFTSLGLPEIKAITHPGHIVSQHILDKIGMTPRGLVAYDGLDGTGGHVALYVATRPTHLGDAAHDRGGS